MNSHHPPGVCSATTDAALHCPLRGNPLRVKRIGGHSRWRCAQARGHSNLRVLLAELHACHGAPD